MADIQELSVIVGVTEAGKYIAASTASPYFCFEADTEENLLDEVRAALAFWEEAHATAQTWKIGSRTAAVTALRPSRVYGHDELLVLA